MYPAGSSVRPLAPGPQSDDSWREGKVKPRGQQAQEALHPPEAARVWAARLMRRLSQLGQGIVSAAESAPRVMTLLKPANAAPGTGGHYPTPRGLSDTSLHSAEATGSFMFCFRTADSSALHHRPDSGPENLLLGVRFRVF